MSLEQRAFEASKAVAEYHGLSEKVQALMHTLYVAAASDESQLHEGEEGSFGQAVESLKLGKYVARKGWNGKGMFLWLKPYSTVKAEWCHDPKLKAIIEKNGGEMEAVGTICMKTADDKIMSGWVASQTDVLSNDWILV